jgi:hypothetical protein
MRMKKQKIAVSKPNKIVYVAFRINEYQYRHITFTKHLTRDKAERKANNFYFRNEESSVRDDLTPMVMTEDELRHWVVECNYELNWKERTMIYKGE